MDQLMATLSTLMMLENSVANIEGKIAKLNAALAKAPATATGNTLSMIKFYEEKKAAMLTQIKSLENAGYSPEESDVESVEVTRKVA